MSEQSLFCVSVSSGRRCAACPGLLPAVIGPGGMVDPHHGEGVARKPRTHFCFITCANVQVVSDGK